MHSEICILKWFCKVWKTRDVHRTGCRKEIFEFTCLGVRGKARRLGLLAHRCSRDNPRCNHQVYKHARVPSLPSFAQHRTNVWCETVEVWLHEGRGYATWLSGMSGCLYIWCWQRILMPSENETSENQHFNRLPGVMTKQEISTYPLPSPSILLWTEHQQNPIKGLGIRLFPRCRDPRL